MNGKRHGPWVVRKADGTVRPRPFRINTHSEHNTPLSDVTRTGQAGGGRPCSFSSHPSGGGFYGRRSGRAASGSRHRSRRARCCSRCRANATP